MRDYHFWEYLPQRLHLVVYGSDVDRSRLAKVVWEYEDRSLTGKTTNSPEQKYSNIRSPSVKLTSQSPTT